MRNVLKIGAVALLFIVSLLPVSNTQTAQNRISGVISNGPTFALTSNIPPAAKTLYDQGLAPGSLKMTNMTLMLEPTTQQHSALLQLLKEQQDRKSPSLPQVAHSGAICRLFRPYR